MKSKNFLVFLTLMVTALVGFALPFLSSGKDWDPVFFVGLKTVALQILPTSQHHLIVGPVATDIPISASEFPITETPDPAITPTSTPTPTAQLSFQPTNERRDRREENSGFLPVTGPSAQPANTAEPQPTPTNTRRPTPTNTFVPQPTNTTEPQPTPTNTRRPTPTRTQIPTQTQAPTPTDPPQPTPTDPPQPTPTDPPQPTPTDPPLPTEPPATEPPATEPPATEPPATEPPATEPPATEPPSTEPPAATLFFFSLGNHLLWRRYTEDLLRVQLAAVIQKSGSV